MSLTIDWIAVRTVNLIYGTRPKATVNFLGLV